MIWQLLNLVFIASCCYLLQPAGTLKRFYWAGLAVKVAGGLVLGWVYLTILQSGDTLIFHENATARYLVSQTSFADFLKALFQAEHPVFMGEARTELFTKILSVCYWLTGGSYWVSSIYLSVISFMGSWYFLLQVKKYLKPLLVPALIAFLFFPSVVFWTSGVMKDTLTNGALWLLAGITLRYYYHARLHPVEPVMTALALLLLFYLKFYLAAMAGLVMGAVAIHQFLQHTPLKRPIRLGLVVAGIAVLVAASTLLNRNLNLSHLPDAVYQNYQEMSLNSPDGRSLKFPSLEPTYVSLVTHIPIAVISGLFRPYLWEVNGALLLFAFENLLLLALCIYNAIFIRKHPFNFLIGSSIGYIITLAYFLSLAAPNFGTLTRYKAAYLPLLAFLLLIIPYQRIFSKE